MDDGQNTQTSSADFFTDDEGCILKAKEEQKEKIIEVRPKQKCWLLRLIFPESVTPLQMKIAFSLFLNMLGSSCTITLVFAYLPRLIRDFGTKEVDIGTYAGIIASSLPVGRVIGSYFWGILIDRCGRRRTTLTSTLLLAIFTILFGFNWSYTWVTIARFSQGLVSGIVVVSKAVASDISDESNQSAFMGIIMSAFSVGLILGPSVGGFLSLPHEKYPAVFSKDSFFGIYPFLLPNLIVAVMLVGSTICSYFWLPETMNWKKTDSSEKNGCLKSNSNPSYTESTHETTDIEFSPLTTKASPQPLQDILKCYDYTNLSEIYTIYSFKKQDNALEGYNPQDSYLNSQDTMYNKNDDLLLIPNSVTHSNFYPEKKRACCGCTECLQSPKKEGGSTFSQLMRSHDVRASIFIYGLLSFVTIGYEELIPVYTATYSQYHGLSFSTSEIGTLLIAQTVPNIIFMIFIIPKLEVRFGPRKLYTTAIYMYAFWVALVPCCSKLPKNGWLWVGLISFMVPIRIAITMGYLCVSLFVCNAVEQHQQGAVNGLGMALSCSFSGWLWVGLISFMVPIRIAITMGYLCVSLFVCNAVEQHQQGAVNGLGMALSCSFRSVSPVVIGSVFSWSLKNEKRGFPFNYNFPFLLLSFSSVLTLLLAITLPESIDRKKISSENISPSSHNGKISYGSVGAEK